MKANIWLLTVIRRTCQRIISNENKPGKANTEDKRRMKNPVGSNRPDETNRHRICIALIRAIVCVMDVQLQPDILPQHLLLSWPSTTVQD